MASHQLNPLNLLTAGLQKSWLQGWCFREDEVLHQNELRQSPRCSLCISSVSFGLSPQNLLITLNCRSAAGDEVARKPKLLNQEVQSSQEDQLDREGRFLLYWITTTSVSTSTSFTTTVSISGKVICTTSGIDGVNVCGKWFWWFPPPWYPPPPSARPFTAPLVWIVQTEEWPLVDQPKQPMWYTICYL